jgi:hypothetical protein
MTKALCPGDNKELLVGVHGTLPVPGEADKVKLRASGGWSSSHRGSQGIHLSIFLIDIFPCCLPYCLYGQLPDYETSSSSIAETVYGTYTV